MQTIEKYYYEILSQQVNEAPDREAIVMGETRLTYRQLVEKIEGSRISSSKAERILLPQR